MRAFCVSDDVPRLETDAIATTVLRLHAESTITPEIFAKIFCLDVELPYDTYGAQIASSIRSQLDEHMGVAEVSLLTPEQEAARVEGDLRVILNVSAASDMPGHAWPGRPVQNG